MVSEGERQSGGRNLGNRIMSRWWGWGKDVKGGKGKKRRGLRENERRAAEGTRHWEALLSLSDNTPLSPLSVGG